MREQVVISGFNERLFRGGEGEVAIGEATHGSGQSTESWHPEVVALRLSSDMAVLTFIAIALVLRTRTPVSTTTPKSSFTQSGAQCLS
jgi:hypothetical protein